MNANRIRDRRIENYKEYIRNILRNRDIDCDETWWDYDSAVIGLESMVQTETWCMVDSDQMHIDSSENFLFLKYTKQDPDRNLIRGLKACACKTLIKSRSGNLIIVCIVDNMRSRVFLEKTFFSGTRKEIKDSIRSQVKGWRGTVNFLYILDNNYGGQDIKLTHINRFDFNQMPPIKNHINWEKEDKQESSNTGYVTSVDLRQLVEIYNTIGDKLFKRNVRYGLNEQLGVDWAIKDTLRNSPGEFWFRNNGVTILVERPDFKLDRVEEVLLEHVSEYGDLHFSVVNGAQTITAAAQCLYEMEYELEELKKKEDKEAQKKLEGCIRKSRAAQVLLRIIHIPASGQKAGYSEDRSAREVNEISVALNRQKPIKAEDIAFASPFVEKLASFLEREQEQGKRHFRLVKRGEGNMLSNSIDLVDFARARKASAGHPGEARSNGTNVLLSFKNDAGGEHSFKDEVIFVPKWMDADEENEAAVFAAYYGAVNFGVRVSDFYGKHYKNILINDLDRQITLQNGKWYFTAYMVQLFNRFEKDFSRFTDCFDLIKDKLQELMTVFAGQCVAVAHTHEAYSKIDSNMFKNNELYGWILKEADSGLFAAIINKDLDEEETIEIISYEEARRRREPEAKMEKTEDASKTVNGKAKFIQFDGGGSERVSSTAHAMIKTVQYILSSYPGHEDELLKSGQDWFTDDREKAREGYSYMRRAVEITGEDGRTFWVGTHSPSNTKYSQIRALCKLAGVKENTVRWFAVEDADPLFAW